MDDKRFYRNLKRIVKKSGNRKRRIFLKNFDANIEDFDFGEDNSQSLNKKTKGKKK